MKFKVGDLVYEPGVSKEVGHLVVGKVVATESLGLFGSSIYYRVKWFGLGITTLTTESTITVFSHYNNLLDLAYD